MWLSRSTSPGTQPMPPSDSTILMSGNRTGMREYSQSTAENMEYPKNSTPTTSGGASSAVDGDVPDEPMCRLMTVPVSAQARMMGSQCPVCSDGMPSRCGASVNVTA